MAIIYILSKYLLTFSTVLHFDNSVTVFFQTILFVVDLAKKSRKRLVKNYGLFYK